MQPDQQQSSSQWAGIIGHCMHDLGVQVLQIWAVSQRRAHRHCTLRPAKGDNIVLQKKSDMNRPKHKAARNFFQTFLDC